MGLKWDFIGSRFKQKLNNPLLNKMAVCVEKDGRNKSIEGGMVKISQP